MAIKLDVKTTPRRLQSTVYVPRSDVLEMIRNAGYPVDDHASVMYEGGNLIVYWEMTEVLV